MRLTIRFTTDMILFTLKQELYKNNQYHTAQKTTSIFSAWCDAVKQ